MLSEQSVFPRGLTSYPSQAPSGSPLFMYIHKLKVPCRRHKAQTNSLDYFSRPNVVTVLNWLRASCRGSEWTRPAWVCHPSLSHLSQACPPAASG